ncbi:MAG: hypothetical protein ABIG93_02915 [archaeon]
MQKLKVSRSNKESRINFVNYWAEFVRTHSDKEWGEQQKNLINSMLQSARSNSLTPKQYLKIKGEKVGRNR